MLTIDIVKGKVSGGGLAKEAYVELYFNGALIDTTDRVLSPFNWWVKCSTVCFGFPFLSFALLKESNSRRC